MSDKPSGQQGIQQTPAAAGQHGLQHGAAPAEHHGHGTAATPLPFTTTDLQEFQQSDIQAGSMLVALLGGIFCIGLVLYAVIAGIICYGHGAIA